ncbi:hypothetical protein ACSBR2_033882 [Camellia fascicularis]
MYHSNITGVIKTILEVNLDERHIRQLKKTPFWLMIESIWTHNLKANTFKKCDETVCRIIKTYNSRDEKFYVRGHGLVLRNSNIQLILGIQCGKDKLDVLSSPKPTSDFMQRRCLTVGRISCKLVKDLLFDMLKGRTKRDEEDVAKLLCLYICGKLFFATTGESIGWSLIRMIDRLDKLQNYDWTATIRNTLVNSLNDFHIRPEKVTGCVVALLVNYDKLCETILKRCTLSVPNDDQVPIPNENAKLVVQMEEQMNEIGNVVVELENTEPSFDCWKPDLPNGGHVDSEPTCQVGKAVSKVVQQKEKPYGRMVALEDGLPNLFPDLLELSSTPVADGDGDGESLEADLRNALLKNKELEDGNKRKSIRINELEARVDVMERMIGTKAVNMFIGVENVIIAKDAEIARLSTLVTQLDGNVATLQDQVDDHETHAVTQSATNIESSKRQPSEDQVEKYGNCNDSYISGTKRNSVSKTLKSKSMVPMGAVCIEVGDAVEVDSPLKKTRLEIPHSNVAAVSSLVRCVKNKPRCELRLPDYEYPKMVGRGRQVTKICNILVLGQRYVVDIDEVEHERKTWNGFGMTHRDIKWTMLSVDDQQ